MPAKTLLYGVVFFIITFGHGQKSIASDYIQIPGVIHVHSTFSSGQYTIEELVDKATDEKLEVLVLTDHDYVVMEYGIPVFRQLIKRREERKSIIQTGPRQYLDEVERQNKRQNKVIVIPGAQSSPFYYWSGNPIKKNLTAHNYRKELLFIGMGSPDDYLGIPLLHRGFSSNYFKKLLPRSIVFVVAVFFGFILIFKKGFLRKSGAVICVIGLVLLINHHPFQSSLYDPYSGDKGIKPYQEAIDYVLGKGGLVFWAHPESNYSKKGVRLGPITLKTDHYANDLVTSDNYTGFSAIYGDTGHAHKPGREWDQTLIEYSKGVREKPVWAIAGSDFHKTQKGHELSTFQTIFLIKKKHPKDVLSSIRDGRMYAVRSNDKHRLILERFTVKDEGRDKIAVMGETLTIRNKPVVFGRIDAAGNQQCLVDVLIVKGGNIWMQFKGKTPLEFNFEDREPTYKRTYYRLEVRGKKAGKLLSNPIFIRAHGSKT